MISVVRIIQEMSKKSKFGLGIVGGAAASEGIGAAGQKYFTNRLNKIADQRERIGHKMNYNSRLGRDAKTEWAQKRRELYKNRGLSDKEINEKFPIPSDEKHRIFSNKYNELTSKGLDVKDKAEGFKDIRPSELIRSAYEKFSGEN